MLGAEGRRGRVADVGGKDAATGVTGAPTGTIARGAFAPGTIAFDWLLTGLCGLIAAGGYMIVKGGRAGTLGADALVSIPSLVLYGGAIPAIVLLGWAATTRRSGAAAGRPFLPASYQPGLLGAILFVGGLVLALLDIGSLDADIVAGLVSPGALLLAAGATLIASGPVLAFGDRGLGRLHGGPGVRLVPLGLAVAAAWLLAIPSLFVAVAHPWVTDAGLGLSDEPPFTLHTDLYAIPLAGTSSMRLTATPDEDEVHPAVHPDGSRIAVGRGSIDELDVWMLGMDGTDIARVTDTPDANEDGMTWSPDGTRLAWWSDLTDAPAVPERSSPAPAAGGPGGADAPAAPPGRGVETTTDTWVADANGGNPERLAHPETNEGVESWSPDGSRLCGWLFIDEAPDVGTFGLDGSDPVRVTDDPGEDWSCSWSPTGDRLAFHAARDGDYEIFTVAPDGSDERRLTENDGMDMLPRWSPDGRLIAFISDASGEIEVYVMDPDGGNIRDVSLDPALDDGIYGIDWTPDGTTIVAASAGRSYAPEDDASFRGAVGAIALAAIILGTLLGLLLRFRPRIGTFTVVLGVTGLLVGYLGESVASVVAFIVTGLVTDAVAVWALADPGTVRAGVTGAVATAVLAGATFVAGSVGPGLAWDGERVVGAVLLACLVGGASAALAFRPAAARQVDGPTVEGPGV
jgi:TolB protein